MYHNDAHLPPRAARSTVEKMQFLRVNFFTPGQGKSLEEFPEAPFPGVTHTHTSLSLSLSLSLYTYTHIHTSI